MRVNLYTMLDQSDSAVEVGLEYLRRIDISGRRIRRPRTSARNMSGCGELLGAGSIEALLDLPPMSDPGLRATMDVLTALLSPAMFTDENLFRLVVVRMANLSLEHGNSDGACFAYEWLGAVLGSYFGDYPAGFRFGKLGLDLVEKRGLDRFGPASTSSSAIRLGPGRSTWRRAVPAQARLRRRRRKPATSPMRPTAAASLITHLLASGDRSTKCSGRRSTRSSSRGRRGSVSSVDIVTGQLSLIRTLRGLTPRSLLR